MEKETPPHILATPLWILILRGFQFLMSLIILAMAGKLVSDVMIEENALALAIALLTWFVVGYIVLTEKIPAMQVAYNILAVLILDGLWMILWLATFAAVAARRAGFVFDVTVTTYDFRRSLDRRAPVLYPLGGALMAAIAGLGALVWLSFIATFTWEMVMFFRGRKEGRFVIAGESKTDNYHMESKPLQQPAGGVPTAQPTGYAPYGQQGAYPPAAGYAPTMSPPPQDQYQQQQQPYAQQPYGQQGYYPQHPEQPIHPQSTGGYNSELAGNDSYPQQPYTTQSPPPQQPYAAQPPPAQ